jgi:DNA-binding MarR family transcriptional regulator
MNKPTGKLKPHDTSSEVKSTALFIKAGFSPKAAEAIVKIDTIMQRVRRSMAKREFVAATLREMGSDLDLQKLDVLGAVSHWMPEDATDSDREITVGTIAERLNIDPSRASRLVADLVDLGYIRRAASQADSRRIVLEATEKGWAFGEEFRKRKGEALARGLWGWTEDELLTFARLLESYSFWTKRGLERQPKAED